MLRNTSFIVKSTVCEQHPRPLLAFRRSSCWPRHAIPTAGRYLHEDVISRDVRLHVFRYTHMRLLSATTRSVASLGLGAKRQLASHHHHTVAKVLHVPEAFFLMTDMCVAKRGVFRDQTALANYRHTDAAQAVDAEESSM